MNNDKRKEAMKWWNQLTTNQCSGFALQYFPNLKGMTNSAIYFIWVKETQQPADNLHKEVEGHTPGEWISVKDELPTDFNEHGLTAPKLVFIDNPFFANGNYHVSKFQKNPFGEQYNNWTGIESTVHHGDNQPNVTHWMEVPLKPKN